VTEELVGFLIPDNLKSRQDVSQPLRRVAGAFQVALDEDVLVWFEPLYDPAGEKPHFVVLLPDRGIVVLEVFEARAKAILGFLRGRLRFERDGQEVEIHSPLKRAEIHASALAQRVGAEERLRGIDLPVVAGAVFPAMTEQEATEKGLASTIDPRRCLFKAEIDAGVDGQGETAMLRAFTRMLGAARSEPLSPVVVDVLRGLIQPSIVINAIRKERGAGQLVIFRPPDGGADAVRVMDRKQEAMAKSLGEGHRVIRGVAGSGKTLVLAYRVRLVAEAFPARRLLLTCFTKTLAGQLASLMADLPNVSVKNLDGVMADAIRTAGIRHPGYGQDDQGELVARTALSAVRSGRGPRYHGVFLDEAQDFGTTALQFVVALLAPGNEDLVIVADAAQNIFRRKFSWKQAGIQAQGRTRILKTNYRNTKEILEFAFRFLTGGTLQAEDVPGMDDESAVISPESAQRSGPSPELRLSPDPRATVRATVEKVKAWIRNDARPRSAAVLYASSNGPVAAAGLHEALRSEGLAVFWATDPGDKGAKMRLSAATEPVVLCTVHSAKGLEFPRVAMCEIGRDGDDAESARKVAYVGMTRATEELFVATEEGHPLAADLRSAAAASL
jgi:hypothetical protein